MQIELDTVSPKNLESKARRRARRYGLRVVKSRRAISLDNFGEFMLVDATCNFVVGGSRFDWTAEDIIEDCSKQRSTADAHITWGESSKFSGDSENVKIRIASAPTEVRQ